MGLSSTRLNGQPTARSARDLGRTIAYWSVAIRRIAESGAKAWAAVDERFGEEREREESPATPETPDREASEALSGIPMEMVAELDLIVAYMIGDQVLDLVAYAELVRRDMVPTWRPGRDKVPSMWPAFMTVMDDGALDAMSEAARYLDVTLAVARDVLVAHRDPAAVELPSYSSWGSVGLHRPVIDEGRKADAEQLVHEINRALERPWPEEWSDRHLLETIIAVAPQLTPEVRRDIRRVYRLAGFDSPELVAIVNKVIRLVSAYRSALDPPAELSDA